MSHIKALALHFNVSKETIEETGYGSETYTVESEPGEYRVLTDSERDDAISEALDSYLNDCILPELPEVAQNYFDRDAWKRDSEHDGAGHILSSYDGEEHEEKIDGEWYFIYRVG